MAGNTRLAAFWKKLRKEKRLGLRQAAKLAEARGLSHFSKSTIESLEKGTQRPKGETLHAAAAIYGVDYEWLLAEVTRLTFDRAGRPEPQPQVLPDPLSLELAMAVAALELMPDDLRIALGAQVWVTAEHLRIEPQPERIAGLAHVPVQAVRTRLARGRRR